MAEINCDDKLSGAFARKCGYTPKQGVISKWYGNWDDIDKEATQLSNRGTKITQLVLKAGAKIYPAQGPDNTKKVNHALSIGDYSTGYIHTDEFIVTYRGADERERIQELVDGARVFTINRMVDSGVNGELAFQVAGFDSGMKIINDDYDSSANSGTATLIVATKDGEEEGTGLKLFLEGTLSDTEAWIEENEFKDEVPGG